MKTAHCCEFATCLPISEYYRHSFTFCVAVEETPAPKAIALVMQTLHHRPCGCITSPGWFGLWSEGILVTPPEKKCKHQDKLDTNRFLVSILSFSLIFGTTFQNLISVNNVSIT